MSFNLAIMLRESARSFPDKDFLRYAGGRLSYADADELSSRVAAALRGRLLPPGAKVAVQLPNVPEFVMAYFGLLKAGLTMVPLNPLLKRDEIRYHLGDSDAVMLIHAGAPEAYAALSGLPAIESVVAAAAAGPSAGAGQAGAGQASTGQAGAGQAGTPFAELLTADADPDIYPGAADDTAVILYTSGTTGRPKGAELSHFQLYMTCTLGGQTFGTLPDDVSLAVLPLFHVYGLSSILNGATRYGRTIALLQRFSAEAVLDAIERDRVSIMAGVPTMYHELAEADIEGRDLSSLRIGSSGGAAIPVSVLQRFEAKYGITILEGYGLSESASTVTVNPGAGSRKFESIGKPLWGIELRIAGPGDQPLPPGAEHVGEIVLRGHNITKGYYKRPRETAEAFRNGWFYTGDLGYVDDDGFVFVVDRKKDMIIRGGFNVYPREVEELLYRHPAVLAAAVVGRPDPRLGEEVQAFVVLRPDSGQSADDVRAWVKERIAAYKYPREIHLVDALPKGPTGKIHKQTLRDAARAPGSPAVPATTQDPHGRTS
jgi:long-chain acyl-CoA synthetase